MPLRCILPLDVTLPPPDVPLPALPAVPTPLLALVHVTYRLHRHHTFAIPFTLPVLVFFVPFTSSVYLARLLPIPQHSHGLAYLPHLRLHHVTPRVFCVVNDAGLDAWVCGFALCTPYLPFPPHPHPTYPAPHLPRTYRTPHLHTTILPPTAFPLRPHATHRAFPSAYTLLSAHSSVAWPTAVLSI